VSTAERGDGFHFHAVDATVDGNTFTPLKDYVEERSEGRAICVDASTIRDIGCRPHTLTAMASAFSLSRKAWKA
jgi:hypothetical protein